MTHLAASWISLLMALAGWSTPAHHAPAPCRLTGTHVGVALGSTVTERTYRCGHRIVIRRTIVPTQTDQG